MYICVLSRFVSLHLLLSHTRGVSQIHTHTARVGTKKDRSYGTRVGQPVYSLVACFVSGSVASPRRVASASRCCYQWRSAAAGKCFAATPAPQGEETVTSLTQPETEPYVLSAWFGELTGCALRQLLLHLVQRHLLYLRLLLLVYLLWS